MQTALLDASPDPRLDDYLNDKLQTFADFESLDSLIANVCSQQELLKKQLQDARDDVDNADSQAKRHASSVQQREAALEQERFDLDDQLRSLTRAETNDEAHSHFESVMDKLHRLDLADNYVNILKDVQRLHDEAHSKMTTEPDASLAVYAQLRGLVTGLQSGQSHTDDTATRLLEHVEESCQAVRTAIKDVLVKELDGVLKKILWPKRGIPVPPAFRQEWEVAVKKLLALQKPELEAEDEANIQVPQTFSTVLLPLETMARPLEQRFKYHFNGNQPTNRLDKPEYFLTHFTEILSNHVDFMTEFVQPLLVEAFKNSSVADHANYIDALSAFITALLPMVKDKVFTIFPQVAQQPELLSHLMHQLMEFDQKLRDEWQYGFDDSVWRGLTHDVLTNADWFSQWLQVEKNFALARYGTITDKPDSFTLDYDIVAPNATKPTNAAIRVKDLVETVTSSYKPLSSFSQKLRFLIDIQLSIFDQFHARLHSALEAFLSMTSSVGRAVQGVSAAEAANLQGVGGLDRLCRVFGSADYLARALSDWSDEEFFLELWDELHKRVASTSTAEISGPQQHSAKLVAGPLSVAEVASKTSSSLNTLPGDDSLGGANDDLEPGLSSTLFDETTAAFMRLRTRAETVMIDTLTVSVREALRPYSRSNSWSSLSAPSSSTSADSPSPELAPVLESISTALGFLSRALAPQPLARISRAVAKVMDAYVFERVLSVRAFSTRGAKQLGVDVRALDGLLGRYARSGVEMLRRSTEGAMLLGLSVKGTGSSAAERTEEQGDDDDAAAWDVSEEEAGGDATDEQSLDENGDRASLGLWEVEKRLFADNESARGVLDQLGIDTLTESEARLVLQRRVELAS